MRDVNRSNWPRTWVSMHFFMVPQTGTVESSLQNKAERLSRWVARGLWSWGPVGFGSAAHGGWLLLGPAGLNERLEQRVWMGKLGAASVDGWNAALGLGTRMGGTWLSRVWMGGRDGSSPPGICHWEKRFIILGTALPPTHSLTYCESGSL